MATYVKGTQNHLDIVPVADAAAGDVVPIAECANLVAVYTRPYAANASVAAAAYTGVFRFTTALEDQAVGTLVNITDAGAAVAAAGGRHGVLTKAIVGAPGVAEVAININGIDTTA